MTETPQDSKKNTSIETLRQRVSAVEGRFSRIDHENTDYRQRLSDLMETLADDQKLRRDEVKILEERIETVVSENEQLREILDELLISAEAIGEGRLDEPLADLDARVRGQGSSKDLIGEAAERIGDARAAAEDGTDGAGEDEAAEAKVAEAEDSSGEAKSEVPKAGDDAADPPAETPEDGEADIVDAEIVTEEIDGVAGPDAVELAANEASGEDVLELEAEVVDVEVEIIAAKDKAADEAAEPEPAAKKKPDEAAAADKKEVARETRSDEITTDKETDQLDRILASIRRITSAL